MIDSSTDNNQRLQRLMRRIQNLPTLPEVVTRIHSLVDSPTAGSREIAEIVENDQSLTAKLLGLVNSAFYGREREIGSVRDAITEVGTTTLVNVTLSLGAYEVFKRSIGRFDSPAFWRHAVAVGLIAQTLAESAGLDRQTDHVFTGGLLHDLGKVALAYRCPDEFAAIVDRATDQSETMVEAERFVIGTDHATVGDWVARLWQLPEPIAVAIRHHHEPPGDRQGYRTSEDPIVDVVAVSDWVAHSAAIGNGSPGSFSTPDDACFDSIGIDPQTCRNAARRIDEAFARAVASLGL